MASCFSTVPLHTCFESIYTVLPKLDTPISSCKKNMRLLITVNNFSFATIKTVTASQIWRVVLSKL